MTAVKKKPKDAHCYCIPEKDLLADLRCLLGGIGGPCRLVEFLTKTEEFVFYVRRLLQAGIIENRLKLNLTQEDAAVLLKVSVEKLREMETNWRETEVVDYILSLGIYQDACKKDS